MPGNSCSPPSPTKISTWTSTSTDSFMVYSEVKWEPQLHDVNQWACKWAGCFMLLSLPKHKSKLARLTNCYCCIVDKEIAAVADPLKLKEDNEQKM